MQNYATIGALLFMVGGIWLLVSILRLLSKNSRHSAKRNIKYAFLTIVGSIALPIVGAVVPSNQPSVVATQGVTTEADAHQTPAPPVESELELSPQETAEREAAAREAAIRIASKWKVARGLSSIDDSRIVQIKVESNNNLPARFGGRGPATLSLRCQENTTSATIRFNGHFMADIQSYGRVTYRVDDRPAKTINMQESTNNEWLGLWRGGQSIPFIRELLNADRLVIRATPFSENSMEATFTITGLDLFLGELRSACNW